MGGTISMIIRKPDGEVVPMLRWTNIMPWAFGDKTFLNGDFDAWWPQFSKEWEAMRGDYEANKASGTFKYPMTSAYFPDSGVAPDGYGIVVVDWPSKRLLSSQGYSSPGIAQGYQFRDGIDVDSIRKGAEEFVNRIESGLIPQANLHFKPKPSALSVAKTLVGLKSANPSPDHEVRSEEFILDLTSIPMDKLLALAMCALDPSGRHTKILMKEIGEKSIKSNEPTGKQLEALTGKPIPEHLHDCKTPLYFAEFPYRCGWNFERYEEGAAGMLKLRRELDGLGYTFDQQENLNWYDYIKSNAPRSLIREARDVLGIQTRAAKVKP